MKFNAESISIQNTMYLDKPNEDFYICDNENGIYIILDGVSRDVIEGKYPNPSPAQQVSEIFAIKVQEYLQKELKGNVSDFQTVVKDAMSFGNECISRFNSQGIYSFPPGTVGIILLIRGKNAYFGFIGDCIGKIVSFDNIVTFTKDQTEGVALYRSKYTQQEIRAKICNNPNHPAGYGVLNGTKAALGFIETGHFELSGDKKILLYTDGFEETMDSLSLHQFYNISLKNAEDLAIPKDNKPLDDRTLLIISNME
ncbi:MAG: hypothetical protein FWE24_09000 [Defluviitaleaceae bacterium]|nr:hypothetical protein [Defluviitaleaceae bacterium]